MTDLDQIRYDAFFDEMAKLEKQAMLEKVGGVGVGLWRAGKQLFRSPGNFGKSISKGWQRGIRGIKDPDKAGAITKGYHGLKGALGTRQGQLLAAGAVGVPTAAYLAGRGGGNQNVYVR